MKDGIARSDIRVSEAKRGRVPCRNEGEYRLPSIEHRSKREISIPQAKIYKIQERKNPADSEESAGFSIKCAPWDSNPEPID